jgi:Cu+-exporting ATPase
MVALQPFVASGTVSIIKPLVSQNHPVLELEYIPDPPNFTIRTLIDVIAKSKPSESQFIVKLHKPPTLEERARRMYEHEQHALLKRVIFSIIVAVPTFVIGVVYMSLVSHDNATRMWLMSPMWAGRASRAEWALLFCATPVMFYSCGLFHRRRVLSLPVHSV